MTEPTHIRSSRMKDSPSIYHVEITSGLPFGEELTFTYEIEAGSFAEAELLALEMWLEDEERGE